MTDPDPGRALAASHDPEVPEPVLYATVAGVARITLNRPEKRNAMNPELVDALIAALRRAGADGAVRVVVLTGAGDRAFCAGGDLGGIGERQEGGGTPSAGRDPADLFGAFVQCGKPIVGRLNGHAMAGGLGLACACDIVIAADDVRLGTPEVGVGLYPMVIMSVINRCVGPKQALRLYFTGEPVDAATAARIGLITEAVPRERLDEVVDAVAARIAANSPTALRLGREAYYATRDLPFDEQIPVLAAGLTRVAATEDAREGVRAFVEKRPPVFTAP